MVALLMEAMSIIQLTFGLLPIHYYLWLRQIPCASNVIPIFYLLYQFKIYYCPSGRSLVKTIDAEQERQLTCLTGHRLVMSAKCLFEMPPFLWQEEKQPLFYVPLSLNPHLVQIPLVRCSHFAPCDCSAIKECQW